jgi:hypothetical protein
MAILEVLEATDLDAVAGVAAEDKYAVTFAGECHRSGERAGAGQLQLEDPASVDAQRRTAIKQQRGGDVAGTGQQISEHVRFGRFASDHVDVVADVSVDVEIGSVLQPALHCAMGMFLEPPPHIGGNGYQRPTGR